MYLRSNSSSKLDRYVQQDFTFQCKVQFTPRYQGHIPARSADQFLTEGLEFETLCVHPLCFNLVLPIKILVSSYHLTASDNIT